MFNKKEAVLFLTLTLTSFLVFSCGKSGQENEPKTEASQTEALKQDTAKAERLYINFDIETLASVKKGDSFEIEVAEKDEPLNLQIRRAQETIGGITSISANIGNGDKGQATLVLRDKKLSGIVDFFDEKKKYSLQYDSTRNSYYMLQMLPENMDVLPGSAPLTPNRNGQ